ncbi:AraC family transcriptional regulator [Variovorax sp. J22R115]|uniref:helix-turn-helix transcriptional regulator n=1 Tax=Variovorax sp. J22R115 TaxID=3053509 RepID=UPI0025752FBC|nr:AraC family transcriptional regulator [Variovorax sp. J22R115]MDM0047564.1 helix-turn-helix domain-containing protein [Variovorax sp. J22R115]
MSTSTGALGRVQRAGNDSGSRLRSVWFEPSVHSAYYLIFSRLTAALSQAPPRPFTGQARLLPLLDFLPLLDAVDALHKPDVGATLGWAIQGAAHGPMGLAAMSSRSIAHAMETVARYAPVRNRMFEYRCVRDERHVSLEISDRLDFGDYGHFLRYASLHAIFNIFRGIADEQALSQCALCLPWPRSTQTGELPQAVWSTQYRAKMLAIRFATSVADHPLASWDPEVHRRVCSAGDEELTKLSGSVGAKVRHLFHRSQPDWPSLVAMAGMLGLSRRTLVRRLEDEGLSYNYLLDETRNELACWYLRHTGQSLNVIAEKVGFSDQGNFSRGFRRWQGLAPSQYRLCFRAGASPDKEAQP